MRKLVQWCGSLGVIVSVGAYATGSAPSTRPPEVEYSAERLISAEDGGRNMQVSAQVNYARGMERDELEMHGQRMTQILRHDKQLAWILMPEQHGYMEVSYAKQAQYCNWPCVNVEKAKLAEGKGYTDLGRETVNGVEATKYKIICVDKNGNTTDGLFWVADNGVVVKMDFDTVVKSGQRHHAIIELRHLKIAKQDPGLFEIPAGYRKFDVSAMPLSGGMPAGMGGPGGGSGVGGAGAMDIMNRLMRH